MSVHLIRASATAIPLPDESVQCVVTSPPYWGLRKYAGEQELVWPQQCECASIDGNLCRHKLATPCVHKWIDESEENRDIRTGLGLAEWSKVNARGGGLKPAKVGTFTIHRGTCVRCGAWRGAYGLEPTVEMYVQHTVQILREIRRILRKDGVVFWNIGDSYAASGCGWSVKPSKSGDYGLHEAIGGSKPRVAPPGLKPKDLVLMPARVALAAQADGWWVRSMIIWAKPNPMPESVTDRPTDAYEHILLLAKSEHYYWDATAVREKSSQPIGIPRLTGQHKADADGFNTNGHGNSTLGTNQGESDRNMRNVWNFATQPYSGAHFATFPEELPRRCILAATSERGACAQCGTPWERITETTVTNDSGSGRAGNRPTGKLAGETQVRENHDIRMGPVVDVRTIGWQPACKCQTAETISSGDSQIPNTMPCTVLDPFGGSGTTGRVAVELNRRAVLLDVAYEGGEYDRLARERTTGVQRQIAGLF